MAGSRKTDRFTNIDFLAKRTLATAASGLISLLIVHGIAGSGNSQTFPYVVTVSADDAQLFSGPSQVYYPTQSVVRGQQLQVYGRTPSGWLAIRPLSSSYSMVRKKHLDLQGALPSPGSRVRVDSKTAVSWIGTKSPPPPHHKWQVRLQTNEQLVFLGWMQRSLHAGEPPETLAKIRCPAGEYRWIPAKWVDATNSQPRLLAGKTNGVSSPQSVAVPSTSVSPTTDRSADATATSSATAIYTAPQTPAGPGAIPPITAPLNQEVDNRLSQIHVALAETVLQPSHTWNLQPLRLRVAEILQQETDPLARGRARKLLENIESLQATTVLAINSRIPKLNNQRLQNERTTPAMIAQAPAASTPQPAKIAAADRVNRGQPASPAKIAAADRQAAPEKLEGWLVEVRSRRANAPPYALVDDRGKVITLIRPSAGVQLDNLLKRRLSVVGKRTQVTGLPQPLLIAQEAPKLIR